MNIKYKENEKVSI